ncbi:hypothetical protein VTN77DRAFT_8109 [Rasamsonia byssochlamydoides]|uniref:uncharacterized protein n=1 Tax=Rasamsonia byssochlamydoides TaxID=89139 RepID=UPI0037432798
MSSRTGQALVIRTDGGSPPKLVKEEVSAPQPDSHQALVRVSHTAQNPTDIISFDNNGFGDGAILGCDFAGSVEETGSDVSCVAKGDVVAGLIWGGEIKGLGGYSDYTLADERICFKIPKGISPAQASTVPLASATSWLALFSKDCLNIDRSQGKDISILIWGGSSSVGLYAIQIAAIYGFNIITTCSPRNFDLVRSLGAHHVFDYRDEDVVKKIRAAAPHIKYVFDTIGNPTSSVTASQAIDESGGVLCTVRPGKAYTENVTKQTRVTDVLVWTAFLKEHRYGKFYWPTHKEDHELASELFEKLPSWLEDGKIKPNTPKVLKGLDAVPAGFQEYRDGKISAYKIVYEL